MVFTTTLGPAADFTFLLFFGLLSGMGSLNHSILPGVGGVVPTSTSGQERCIGGHFATAQGHSGSPFHLNSSRLEKKSYDMVNLWKGMAWHGMVCVNELKQ